MIRWAGLYDKNSDMQYAPRQLFPKKKAIMMNISEHRKKIEFPNLGNYWMEQNWES